MRRTYESGIKARLSFSGGSHAPVNMADSMEVNVGGKNPEGNGTLAALYCAIFRTPSFRKSFKFFGTAIAILDPETVQSPACSILSAMFTGACGPPEAKPRFRAANVLLMIVKLAYSVKSHK